MKTTIPLLTALLLTPAHPTRTMNNTTRSLACGICLGISLGFANISDIAAKPSRPASLSEKGKQLQPQYEAMLAGLKAEIVKEVPTIPEKEKSALMEARAGVAKATADTRDAKEALKKGVDADNSAQKGKSKRRVGAAKRESANPAAAAYQAAQDALAKAVATELAVANDLLKKLDSFLSSNKLDAKLALCTVLVDATPKGLAEFASQGKEQATVVKKLLADEALIKAMLAAGGPKDGKYGRAAEIYAAIQTASPRAKDGLYQKLALAVSLEHASPVGQKNPVAATNAPATVDPVRRYQYLEKASLDGELDPAFKTLGVWELRHVVNGNEPDEMLTWGRDMLRNYRPDHVLNPDYGWRYSKSVNTDVRYLTDYAKNDVPTLHFYQNIIKNGGVCGRRAFFGRFIIRSFGLPTLPRPQKKHGALVRWTPEGWVTNLGGGWGCPTALGVMNLSDEDFLIESQVRRNPTGHAKALRAQWAGDALGERKYESLKPEIGGIWNILSLYAKRAAVGDKTVALEALGEELGEANESEEVRSRAVVKAKVTEADKKIVIAPNGTITIPAAAASGAQILGSFSGGHQIFSGSGSITFDVDVRSAGKYALTAKVVTVQDNPKMQLIANNASPVEIAVPYTIGKWAQTPAAEVTLAGGKNTLRLNRQNGSRGLSIKEFTLTPVK